MPFFPCQICYKDFGNADALRKHYDKFEAEEQASYQEYLLCRKHDLSKLNSSADTLEPDPSDSDAPGSVCQCCQRRFSSAKALDNHVQDYMVG